MPEKARPAPPSSRAPGRPGVEFPEAFAAFLRLLRSSPEPRVTVRRLRAELGTGSHGKISEHLASCWARVAAMLEAGSPDALRRLPGPIADEFERLYRLIEEAVRQDVSRGAPEGLMRAECSELAAQCTALNRELADLRGDRASEQKCLQDERDRAAGLDKQNHELTVRVTELQQRLADRERHLQLLGDQNDALTRLLSRAHTERRSLERRAEQLQQDLSELRERFQSNLSLLMSRSRSAAMRPPPLSRKARQVKKKPKPSRKVKAKGDPRKLRRSPLRTPSRRQD